MTAGTTTLTSPSTTFVAADVGKAIAVGGVAAAIVALLSATSVRIADGPAAGAAVAFTYRPGASGTQAFSYEAGGSDALVTTTGSGPGRVTTLRAAGGAFSAADAGRAITVDGVSNTILAVLDARRITLVDEQTSVATHGDGVVTGATTLTSLAATFTAADVGKAIAVGAITTTIASVVDANTVTLARALADASGLTLSYARSVAYASVRELGDAIVTAGASRLGSASATFAATDVGKAIVVGSVANTIAAVLDANTVRLAVNAAAGGPTAFAYNPSATDGDVAALSSNLASRARTFVDGDVGRTIVVDATTTTIAAVLDEHTVRLAAVLPSGAAVAFSIDGDGYADGVLTIGRTRLRSASASFVRQDTGRAILVGGVRARIVEVVDGQEALLDGGPGTATGVAFSYEPAFDYVLSAQEAGRIAAGVKVWTPDQLQNLLGAGLLKPVTSTVAVFGEAIVRARDVTLIAGGIAPGGAVGRHDGEQLVALDGHTFTPEENVLLTSAERTDIAFLGGRAHDVTVDVLGGANTIALTGGRTWAELGVGADVRIRVVGATLSQPDGFANYRVAAVAGAVATIDGSTALVTQLGASVRIVPIVDPTITATVAFAAASATSGATITRLTGSGWGAIEAGSTITVGGNSPNATGPGSPSGVSFYTVASVAGNTLELAAGDVLATTAPAPAIAIRPLVVDPTFVAIAAPLAATVDFTNEGFGPGGRVGDTITWAGGDLRALFAPGDVIAVTGTDRNATASFTPFHVVAVSEHQLRLATNDVLVDEAGVDVQITRGAQPTVSHIAVAKVTPVNIAATGVLDVTANGNVLIGSRIDLRVGTVQTPGQVRLKTAASIRNAGGSSAGAACAAAPPRVNACTGDLVLEAGGGRIGTPELPFLTDFVDGAVDGALTARAKLGVHLHNRTSAPDPGAGDLRIESVYSEQGVVRLEADGSILDALASAFTKVFAPTIQLRAGGTIGAPGDPLEVLADLLAADGQGSVFLDQIALGANRSVMRISQVRSEHGDVTLRASSIRDAADVSPTDAFAPGGDDIDVVANSITLDASSGTIGIAGEDLRIATNHDLDAGDAGFPGTLTSFSGLSNTYVVQPFGDLYLHSVGTTGADRIAFITAPDGTSGRILNGRGDGGVNVTSGRAKLFAAGDIGSPARYLTTGSGLANATPATLQGRSTTGSVYIVNHGPVSVNCVSESAACDPDGILAGGAVDLVAINAGSGGATDGAITLTRDITAGQSVTLTSGTAAGNVNDVRILAGRSITTTGGGVTIVAGAGIVLEAGSSISAPGTIAMLAGESADGGSIFATTATVTSTAASIAATAQRSAGGALGDVVLHAGSAYDAAQDVALDAGGDVVVQDDAHVLAGRDATLLAGDAITISTSSSVSAGRDATLTAAGGDLVVAIGSAVAAGRDVAGHAHATIALAEDGQIVALRDVTLTTATDDVLLGLAATPALVRAITGAVLIAAADDVRSWPTAIVLAAQRVTIRGDRLAIDPAGTIITLEGAISAPLIEVFGNVHDDTIVLDHVLLGGRTRVYGSAAPTPASTPQDPDVFAPEGDGDDTFVVVRLPTMDDIGAGNTVTIDGQSGSNTTTILHAGAARARRRTTSSTCSAPARPTPACRR